MTRAFSRCLARRVTFCFNGSMTTVAISLKDEDQRFLEEALKSGRYLSASEVVAEALADFRARDASRRANLDDLRAKVAVGIEQANCGDFVEFTAEDVKREGRERQAAQQAPSH
jgi:antitoxin ParD1/3/4